MLKELIAELSSGRNLALEQVEKAVACLVDESVATPEKADFLTALAQKGETAEEIASFAQCLRARAVRPEFNQELRDREILDVVGTGGDRLSTFNISTTVALLAAAAGALVAKHGNRASTSPVGSADVMDALGLPFDIGPEEAVNLLRRHGFTYFFAPRYHPAFRHVIPARKLCGQKGQPTIFNFLGPLLNPGLPSTMLLGVARPALCQPLAQVLQSLGVRRAMVVCGSVPDGNSPARYLDELSPLGPNHIAEFYQERGLNCSLLDPGMFPLEPATLSDLHGGDRDYNAALVRAVLKGDERGPKRGAVLLNAAAALFVAGRSPNLQAGWQLAAETIDSGRAWSKFVELQQARSA